MTSTTVVEAKMKAAVDAVEFVKRLLQTYRETGTKPQGNILVREIDGETDSAPQPPTMPIKPRRQLPNEEQPYIKSGKKVEGFA